MRVCVCVSVSVIPSMSRPGYVSVKSNASSLREVERPAAQKSRVVSCHLNACKATWKLSSNYEMKNTSTSISDVYSACVCVTSHVIHIMKLWLVVLGRAHEC